MSVLRYSSSKQGKVMVINIGGNLDAETAPKFNEKLTGEIKKGAMKVLVNMENLEYIASAGLGVLISANETLKKKNGDIKISAMNDKIKKIFKLLGFTNLFKVYDTDEKALDSF
ncbi:MAG: STAS domain-containing protein [bacterium]|nr:STAS domain-containing protein [bacterium]